MTKNGLTDEQVQTAFELFRTIQYDLWHAFESIEALESHERVQARSWYRGLQPQGQPGGGGTMGVIRGKVIEKAGANVSLVMGEEYPALENHLKGMPFLATGVSTITHMMNPHAPIAHMNVRLLKVGDTFWVGGGADLTPMVPYAEDTEEFHDALKKACQCTKGDYPAYKEWCDRYFYIPHRKEPRGVGGIFFDEIKGSFEELLELVQRVAKAYVDVYPKILKRRLGLPFDSTLKEKQLYWRARYAEFNLAYDRGTRFGLLTGGNIDSILVSMPPLVRW